MLLLWLLAPRPAVAHDGHGSPLPWDVCAASARGDVCEFETAAHERHIGTCRSMSGALVCVRNRPIVPASEAPEGPSGAGMGVAAEPVAPGWASAFALGLVVTSGLSALLWRLVRARRRPG